MMMASNFSLGVLDNPPIFMWKKVDNSRRKLSKRYFEYKLMSREDNLVQATYRYRNNFSLEQRS